MIRTRLARAGARVLTAVLWRIDERRHGPLSYRVVGIRHAERVYADGFRRPFTPPPITPLRYTCSTCNTPCNSRDRRGECWSCAADRRLTASQRMYLADVEETGVDTFPHCDSRVLHAPGACRYCDLPAYDVLRDLRASHGIAFTGRPEKGLAPCPSETRRPLSRINRWPGNRAEV